METPPDNGPEKDLTLEELRQKHAEFKRRTEENGERLSLGESIFWEDVVSEISRRVRLLPDDPEPTESEEG